mgnify:FL=1
MNEAVTKRFLLYFRLMLLVWILIVNSILHVVGFEYSWLIFLSNIMLFTMEGDIKDRFVSVELGGLVGMVFTVIALLAITFLTPVLGSFFGFLIPLAVVLFVLIILHPYAPRCSTMWALPTSRWPASTPRPSRPTCRCSLPPTSSARWPSTACACC